MPGAARPLPEGHALRHTPLDEAWFRALPLMSQLDTCAMASACRGNVAMLPAQLMHLAWFAALNACHFALTYYHYHYTSAASDDYWDLFTKNFIAFVCFVDMFHLQGEWQGPLSGQPPTNPFPLTKARWMPGTYKGPFFSFLGKTRGWNDGLVWTVLGGNNLAMLFLPHPPPALYVIHAASLLLVGVTDHAAYGGVKGFIHGPQAAVLLSRAVYGDAGWIAGFQVWFIIMYVGCGVAKLRVFFSYVFAVEWCNPPWFAGRALWRRLVWRNVGWGDPAGNDFTPTAVARAAALSAGLFETLVSLLIFLTPAVVNGSPFLSEHLSWADAAAPVYVGVAGIVAMHMYIILHLPCFDVNLLNTYPAFLFWYMCVYKSTGFDYDGFAVMPLPLKVFLAVLAAYSVYGQHATNYVGYFYCYRFWAGNWPVGFFLLSGDAKKKLAPHLLAPLGFEGMKGIIPDWEIKVINNYMVAMGLWQGNLCVRPLPMLLEKALRGQNLADVVCVWEMWLMQNVAGCKGNQALAVLPFLPWLQDRCGFAPGELTYIRLDSFSLFGRTMEWQLIDACRGVTEQGRVSVDDCIRMTHPSARPIELTGEEPRPGRRTHSLSHGKEE